MSFESSGFPVVVCAPETTQLFDPAKHASQISGGSKPERKVSRCFSDTCFAVSLCTNCSARDNADGGRSRQEVSGYRSAACAAVNFAMICSRACSVGNVVLRLSEILMPTMTESTGVHGRGV